ncbi:MAG: COX15/CtaA family protein [Frankiaceae bacterium]
MTLPRIGPTGYRRITLVALVALAAIVVTGGAVRLTSSGLGCSTWPNCEPGSLTPEFSLHPMVEFTNRLVSAAVGLAVVATVIGAQLRRPARRDLTLLSLGLVVGFLAQAVLGGLTVLFHLSPVLVMGHFLVSMLLLWDAYALWERAGFPVVGRRPVVRREVLLLGRLVMGTAAVVLVLGTVVTGTGPNSGASVVSRLPFDLKSVAQLHSDAVLFLTGVTVTLTVVLRIVGAPEAARLRCRVLLGLIVAQGAVGFTQYFLDLPRVLVGVHVLGATLFWLATLSLLSALYAPIDDPDTVETEAAARSLPTLATTG